MFANSLEPRHIMWPFLVVCAGLSIPGRLSVWWRGDTILCSMPRPHLKKFPHSQPSYNNISAPPTASNATGTKTCSIYTGIVSFQPNAGSTWVTKLVFHISGSQPVPPAEHDSPSLTFQHQKQTCWSTEKSQICHCSANNGNLS